MKTQSDNFELTPEILSGMDGAKNIPAAVGRFAESGMRAGDGVDYAIACAASHAQDQGEDASEVLHHLKYQRDQLSILISNLERLPEGQKLTPTFSEPENT